MKLRLAILLALVAVAAPARADFKALASPGPLADSHKAFESQCDKCHVPFKGIPSASCLACHERTRERIASGIGTHARFEKEGRKCASCHGDHKGRKHALSPPVPSTPGAFDHAITGFALVGKHQSLACASCHKSGPDGPRWVGMPTTCAGCHKDPHKGSLGQACTTCHTSLAWKPPTKTLADHKIDMTAGHAGLACASCHKSGTHLTKSSSCGDCHEQQHGGTKAPCTTCHNTKDWKSASFLHDFCTCILPGKHQSAPCLSCHPKFRFLPTPFACAACHKKDLKHDDLGACAQCHSALSWKTRAFDHNKPRVGFKLDGRHLEVGCENCHTTKGVFKGAPKACESCHKIPQHGDFGACARCHTTAGFEKPTFSHDKTEFPLDGQHQQASCAGCHAKFKKGEFQKGPNACVLCHKDPHSGQFSDGKQTMRLGFGVLLAANGPAHTFSKRFGCLDCHTTRGWKPSTIDVARHAGFGVELKGKHQTTRCQGCHEGGTFIGTPQDCAACHLGPHRGRVSNDCRTCHDERGWKPESFDHFKGVGFKLEGPHARACANCHGERHEKLVDQKKVGCATCHTPAHGDQFPGECTSCHKPTRFSDVPAFEHNRTLFPLDRRHAAVRCTTCHDRARGPRLDPNCRSCHGDPHRGRTLLDCGECHRADRWSLVRFDHDRTEFPLRGRHFSVACRDCHANDQYTGVRSECVGCHRPDRQRADQLHLDHRSFGFDCSECHRTFNW